MNWLINFASNRVLGPVWNFLDGKKTAVAAGLSILSGLTGLGGEIVPLLASHNSAGLLALVKSFPTDPAYLLFIGGLGALGIGHKIDKAADPVADVPK